MSFKGTVSATSSLAVGWRFRFFRPDVFLGGNHEFVSSRFVRGTGDFGSAISSSDDSSSSSSSIAELTIPTEESTNTE